MIAAVGVDRTGREHVLGIGEGVGVHSDMSSPLGWEGATENSTVITEQREDINSRGVDPRRWMLFVIDESKALREAINAVFGSHRPVQRCRAHKLLNVLGYLPKEQREQVQSILRAAWRPPAKEGMARVKKLAAGSYRVRFSITSWRYAGRLCAQRVQEVSLPFQMVTALTDLS